MRARRGFTLIEIMIVVLIIGILLAIAVPNFIKTRETSRSKTCIENLYKIQGAKEMWAMDHNKPPTDMPTTVPDLIPDYLKLMPECPSGGTYDIGIVNASPTCSIGGLHVSNR